MKFKKRKTIIKNLKLFSRNKKSAQPSAALVKDTLWLYVFSFSLSVCLLGSACWAVGSKITRHASNADLSKGETEDVVVDSRGTIQLGRAAETLIEELENVWSINSIVVSGDTVYLGTSPNGGIYKYSLGKLTKIYPPEPEKENENQSTNVLGTPYGESNDVNQPDSETVEAQQHLSNEHIFAMATDIAGRLLAGISGDKCLLCRFEAGEMKVIFALGTPNGEPNDATTDQPSGGTKYIFAITTDDAGNIYLGTGPEGKIYRLNPFGKEPQLIYDSTDKNILSLAMAHDGFLYAGTDSRGLVYKINPRTKTATVLYDSDQPEITALLFTQAEQLYAAATSAKIAQAKMKLASQLRLAGRPEAPSEKEKSPGEGEGGLKLQIANTKKGADDKPSQKQMHAPKPPKPTKASYIYKITKDGFVTNIFSRPAVFFCLTAQDKKLLVGTGNSGQLFTVEPDLEQEAIIYEDQQASQITAVAVSGASVYLGTANPAKLIKLGNGFAHEGTYHSDLIDAGQPARWGKLQIEADIPKGCRVLMASRSGNVKDINDPTFSHWTKTTELTEPIQLRCPPGRFCQYKLVLQSETGQESPIVREIAVAHTIPNLAPKVESVSVNRIKTAGKTGVFKISYKTTDDNGDKLIYKIDFRKIGRTNWIELKDKIEADSFQWDAKTVEDGRYEIRVTASDERSNSAATKLTGSRIGDPTVVDNTGPVIENAEIKTSPKGNKKSVTMKLQISDKLSAIGRLNYTVDSNEDWISTVPDDLVYDTTEENFTLMIEDLAAGEHIIAVKVSDDLGNTTYKTFEVNL